MAQEFNTLQEIVLEANRRLPAEVWDFIIGGGESETTIKRNRRALDSLVFRPELLRDVSRIDTSTTLLGHPLRMPVVLSPMGSVALIDPEGALSQAKAASEFGLISFYSGVADPSPERVTESADCPLVYTLYGSGDAKWMDDTLDRVRDLGFNAVAILADNALYARRDRDLINKIRSKVVRREPMPRSNERPSTEQPRNNKDPALYAAKMTWETAEYIKQRTGLPLSSKGSRPQPMPGVLSSMGWTLSTFLTPAADNSTTNQARLMCYPRLSMQWGTGSS